MSLAGEVYDQAPPLNVDEIPVIDITGFDGGSLLQRQAIADAVAEACSTVGFLYVEGHGLSPQLVDDTFDQARRFFEQSEEDRRLTLATEAQWRGYVPSGSGMGTFRTMLDLPWDDPDVARGKPMHCPNRWPDHLPGFRKTVEAYQDAMMALSVHLRHCFALGLNLPEAFFEPFYRRPLIQQSLLWYTAPESTDPKDLKIGASEHTDTGAFTILMQDMVGGLEVKHRERGWVQAAPIEGTFVVNIGDVMMNWTNGRYVSNAHRVVNRKMQPRMSLPHFANPDYDAVIAPIPQLIEPGSDPITGPIHFGTYMDAFYKSQRG
ncbi:MAG: 2-oxoglutarate and iron-dependent oxygenase domain-containing protein [Pseudomonadota bacterium]